MRLALRSVPVALLLSAAVVASPALAQPTQMQASETKDAGIVKRQLKGKKAKEQAARKHKDAKGEKEAELKNRQKLDSIKGAPGQPLTDKVAGDKVESGKVPGQQWNIKGMADEGAVKKGKGAPKGAKMDGALKGKKLTGKSAKTAGQAKVQSGKSWSISPAAKAE